MLATRHDDDDDTVFILSGKSYFRIFFFSVKYFVLHICPFAFLFYYIAVYTFILSSYYYLFYQTGK